MNTSYSALKGKYDPIYKNAMFRHGGISKCSKLTARRQAGPIMRKEDQEFGTMILLAKGRPRLRRTDEVTEDIHTFPYYIT